MSTLIWTRATEHWQSDAELLLNVKAQVLRLPCIKRELLPIPKIPDGPFQSVMVTSEFAAKIVAENSRLKSLVLTSGEIQTFSSKAAKILEGSGIKVILHSECRSAADLYVKISRLFSKGTKLLFPSALEVATDPDPYFAKYGIEIQRLNLYRSTKGCWNQQEEGLSHEEKSRILNLKEAVICFASPSAVEGFVGEFKNSLPKIMQNFKAVALGNTTQKATSLYFKHVLLAENQTLEGMIQTANNLFCTTIQE